MLLLNSLYDFFFASLSVPNFAHIFCEVMFSNINVKIHGVPCALGFPIS